MSREEIIAREMFLIKQEGWDQVYKWRIWLLISKDSSSIVSEASVDDRKIDVGRWIEGLVRACGIM